MHRTSFISASWLPVQTFSSSYVINPWLLPPEERGIAGLMSPCTPGGAPSSLRELQNIDGGLCVGVSAVTAVLVNFLVKKKKVQWDFTQLVLVTFHMTRKVIDCLFKGALHHLSLSCGEKLHASLRLFFVTPPPCFAFLQVCRKLGIIEVDYFGLQFTGSKGENLWLNLRNRISQQMDNLTPCRLRLRVKFFVEPHLILQEQTRYFWKFARCKDTVCKEICS